MNTFKICQRVLSGFGIYYDKIASEAAAFGAKKIFLVCGPNLTRIGVAQKTVDTLRAGGFEVEMFNEVEPDPSVQTAVRAAEKARAFGAECVIGVGGGSSLDMAKVCAVLMTNHEDPKSLFGVEKICKAGVPLILVPTSAGTGSEVTDIAILSDLEAKLKVGIASRYLIPQSVILDTELTLSLPKGPTAASGLDALIHAMEAYTSVNATPLTDNFAERAIRLIAPNLRTAWARGDRVEAREAMLVGSFYAGIAFCNAGVTAVHAFAYPIGAEYHIPHGVANSIMLIPVFRFNLIGNLPRFARLAEFLGLDTQGLSLKDAAEKAMCFLEDLIDDVQVSRRLRDYGVKEADIPLLAEGALKAGRLLANNPRTMTLDDARAIFEHAM